MRAPHSDRAFAGSGGAQSASDVLLAAVRIDTLDAVHAMFGASAAEAVSATVCDLLRRRLDDATDLSGGVVQRGPGSFDIIAHFTRAWAPCSSTPLEFFGQEIGEWLALIARMPISGPGWCVHVSLSWACRACDLESVKEYIRMQGDAEAATLVEDLLGPGGPLALSRGCGAEDMATAVRLFAALDEGAIRFAWSPIVALGGEDVLYWRAELAATGPDGEIEDLSAARAAIERLGLTHAFDAAAVELAVMGLALSVDSSVCITVSARSFELSPWWAGILAYLAANRGVARRLLVAVDCSVFSLRISGAVSLADRLRRLGVKIVLPRLGAGQAAIQALLALRPDIITIDRCLLALAVRADRDARILLHMVRLAGELAPFVVAEGVDSAEHAVCAAKADLQWGSGAFAGATRWSAPEPMEGAASLAHVRHSPDRIAVPQERWA